MSKKNDDAFLVIVALATIATIALGFTIFLYKGFVLTLMWQWFAVPTFGVKALRIPEAIGLVMLIAATTRSQPRDKAKAPETPEEKTAEMVATFKHLFMRGFLDPTIAVALAWVVKQWM